MNATHTHSAPGLHLSSLAGMKEYLKEFYQNTGDYVPDKIHCYYIEQGDFVADIYTDGNVTDSYIFDSKTEFVDMRNIK